MVANPKHVAETPTMVRSSIMLPVWMERRIADLSRDSFSSRAQVVRKLLADALDAQDNDD